MARGVARSCPTPEQAAPAAKAQRNFTDPESRIMIDGATKSFRQAYNAPAAVDGHAQGMVACDVTPTAADAEQFGPLLEQVPAHRCAAPQGLSAEAGYFSEAKVAMAALAGVDAYVPPDGQGHRASATAATPHPARQSGVAEQLRATLRDPAGRAIYARRKTIPEPVCGQITAVRSFRRFAFRGGWKVQAEWSLVCLTHNLLKLFRAKPRLAPA